MNDNSAQITDRAAALRYITATTTRSFFTLRSVETGVRFTFRVRAVTPDRPGMFFVDVLTGTDNENDYTFAGTLFAAVGCRYVHSGKSRIDLRAPSAVAIGWMVNKVLRHEGAMPRGVEFWHDGKCARCGRHLTDPVSIELGIGPACLEKVNG